MTQIITPDNVDFRAYMQAQEPRVKVQPADAWAEELELIMSRGERITGAKLPWAKTHDLIRFRPGEVTLWQGINGHGKSQMLGQACIGFANQAERVCIASFEMKPTSTLKRMLRQTAMNGNPGPTAIRHLVNWSRGKLWIYDQLGSVDPDVLFAVMRYCSEQLQIKHFIVDSLMKCIRDEDDYNGQKAFVGLLCSMAQDLGMHIHLVHHAKKGENEETPPGKFSAKGSGSIVDQIDQLLTVWRNKKKERLADADMHKLGAVSDAVAAMPDTLLICDKNRHGEWEGKVSLWYHAPSLQYTSDSRRQPMDMIGTTTQGEIQ